MRTWLGSPVGVRANADGDHLPRFRCRGWAKAHSFPDNSCGVVWSDAEHGMLEWERTNIRRWDGNLITE